MYIDIHSNDYIIERIQVHGLVSWSCVGVSDMVSNYVTNGTREDG